MFKEINVRELDRSPIQMISDDWALLTAGKEGDWNTMTVSWGGVGELWGKDVVFVFVRPQRYTLEFMENTMSSRSRSSTANIKRSSAYAVQNRAGILIRPPRRVLSRNI